MKWRILRRSYIASRINYYVTHKHYITF